MLQDAASADPGSLPLLEFVLDALYEAGRERRVLTFAAYQALGGLEGATHAGPTKSSTRSRQTSRRSCQSSCVPSLRCAPAMRELRHARPCVRKSRARPAIGSC